MKKVALTLASVIAAAAFAPEASAVPVFARQTGMACSACHFQHFPLINGFGRAFKAGAYSMVGSQGKVEGEHLDIPDRLNMGVLATTYFQQQSGDTSGSNGKKATWGVPGSGGELSIFYGGRVSEFAGFLSELGLADPQAATGAAKAPMLFPVGDARIGFVPFTGNQGAAYGFELLNTGAADTHKMMGNAGANKEHVSAAYAGSWLGTRQKATGVDVVASNSMGFVVFGQYAGAGNGTGNAGELPLTYIRAAALMDVAGWDTGFGIQNFSGTNTALAGNTDQYAATVLDAQAQGEVAGMSTGLYVTFGMAPAVSTGVNKMAGGWSGTGLGGATNTKASSFNVSGTLEVLPHVATVQGGVRFATLDNSAVAGGKSYTDNAIMLGATYELAQNVEISANYTTQSGTAWDAAVTPVGKTMATVLLETLF